MEWRTRNRGYNLWTGPQWPKNEISGQGMMESHSVAEGVGKEIEPKILPWHVMPFVQVNPSILSGL
jgi:hypothetical protein